MSRNSAAVLTETQARMGSVVEGFSLMGAPVDATARGGHWRRAHGRPAQRGKKKDPCSMQIAPPTTNPSVDRRATAQSHGEIGAPARVRGLRVPLPNKPNDDAADSLNGQPGGYEKKVSPASPPVSSASPLP